MQAFNGFEAKRSGGTFEQLPAGGYVAKILNARVEEYTWGNVLVFSFDICEGQYSGFFQKQYDENDREGKKWKGNYRLTVPQENNQYFESQKRTFGNAIWAVEESNPGYRWDWDEGKMIGKTVGVLFRNAEWEKDGNSGWFTECCSFTSAEEIRNGDYRQPKDKPLKKKTAQTSDFPAINDKDGNLPF